MKSFLFALLPFTLYFIPVCMGQCIKKKEQSGMILHSLSGSSSKCWTIQVPENMYARLDIKELTLKTTQDCSYVYLKITVTRSSETYNYCPGDLSIQSTVNAFSDVTISQYKYNSYDSNTFSLEYHIEDATCAQINHFRCSNRTCIHDSKVCDKVEDCADGSDEVGCEKGVLGVKGVKASRESTGDWLLSNQQSSGWGRNTHRAITALFLADVVSFREQNLEEELMVKQLELQTLLALMRNSTDTLSVNELSMFVNALTVACHDPRRFYGQDLVKILSERTSIAKSPSPGAYLALCSSKWTLMKSDIRSLLHLLHKHSPYPFVSDVQAVAVMALTCVKNSEGKEFSRIHNASNIYNSTIEKFINGQQSDGSFGNVYTTALITQALIASEQVNNTRWNMTSTVQYLMKQLNSSSVDFLSAYLALPVFSGKSLVDIAAANCENISRKQDEDIEFSDVANMLGGKKRIQYSLYVGDQKDVIHTIYMGVTEQSTVYDIMRVAQVIDPKYKFHHRYVSDHIYVYEIAGIINDPEAGKFWLMHSENSNKTVEHLTESPDKFMVDNNGHLIMWYKTAHI